MLMRLHAKLVISQKQHSQTPGSKFVRCPVDIAVPAIRFGFNWRHLLPAALKYFNADVSDQDIIEFHGVIRGLLESDFCHGRPRSYVVPNWELQAIAESFNRHSPRTRMGFVPELAFMR
jgi:hypothetical protein